MKKHYVLDTNVLLHDPQAIFAFDDNNVYVPIYCIEELDGFKRELSELGRNARETSRILDSFRDDGSLADGVSMSTNGQFRVIFTSGNHEKLMPVHYKEFAQSHQMDNLIVKSALDLRDELKEEIIFVTKDTNLRIRADVLGLHAIDYDTRHNNVSEVYSGIAEIDVETDFIENLYREGFIETGEAKNYFYNQYIVIKNQSRENQTALAWVNKKEDRFELIRDFKKPVWSIKPRNKEQVFALHALLNDDIRLVTLIGKAGTGKTLIAVAAGLQKTVREEKYKKLLVSRPVFPLGRDLGYLPGSVEEKLNPWMQPIYDNLEFLTSFGRHAKEDASGYQTFMKSGILQVEPLTYIRGRSLPNQYFIVDEAQNLTPHEVKTVITRVGHGSKIILTGDPYQIDNPYLDSLNNGLVYVAEKMRDERITATITLTKGERSELAELASNYL